MAGVDVSSNQMWEASPLRRMVYDGVVLFWLERVTVGVKQEKERLVFSCLALFGPLWRKVASC